METPSFNTLEITVDDGIATIYLNRPDRMNAFTREMKDELLAAFDYTDSDDAVRAVIVTGNGRAFCAGADLSSGGDTFDYKKRGGEGANPDDAHRDGGGQVALRIHRSLKPVIGAINGAAVGVGVTMQLPMDVRMASENAKFGFVFSRRGIVNEAASSWFLSRVVGISSALEWCFSGRVFSAAEAKERAGALGARTGRTLPGGAGTSEGVRRPDRAGVGGDDPSDDLAHGRCRAPHGSAQTRQPGDEVTGWIRRCARRRGVVSAEKSRRVPRQGVRGPARFLRLAGRAAFRVRRHPAGAARRDISCNTFDLPEKGRPPPVNPLRY